MISFKNVKRFKVELNRLVHRFILALILVSGSKSLALTCTTGNQYTFTGGGSFTSNIIVQNGSILRIRCGKYYMSTGIKITVQKGGYLELYNATLTQQYDNASASSRTLNMKFNWMGIEVLGDPEIDQVERNCDVSTECPTAASQTQTTIGAGYVNPVQGELRMISSKIRYSNYGVLLGELTDNKNQGDLADQGGGLFIGINSDFENNYYRHLGFGFYDKLNKSVIKNNNFKYDQKIYVDPGLYFDAELRQDHHDIGIYDNSFKYAIIDNDFSVNQKVNKFIGMYLVASFTKAIRNTFKWHINGIETVGDAHPNGLLYSSNLIENNIFEECQLAIQGIMDRLTISNNSIKLCTFTRNGLTNFTFMGTGSGTGSNIDATAGIYLYSMQNINCYGNTIIQNSPTLGTQDAGIIFNYGATPSNIRNNVLTGNTSAFRCLNNARNVQLTCNKMSKSTLNDIYIDGKAILSNQGSPNYPTRNTHSRSNNSSYYDIRNLNTVFYNGTNRLKYYYYNKGTDETPSKYSTNTVNPSSSFNSTNDCNNDPQTIGFVESGCGTYITYNGGNGKYAAIKNQKNLISAGGISEEEVEDYQIVLHEYDIALNYVLNEMYNRSIINNYAVKDSVEHLLIEHNTLDGNILLYKHYISYNEISKAIAVINTMDSLYPTDAFVQDFIDYSKLTREWHIHYKDPRWLPEHFEDFKNIGDSIGFMQGPARIIAQYIADIDSNNIFHDTDIWRLPLYEIAGGYVAARTEIITLSPVPFDPTLNVKIDNLSNFSRSFLIKLKDLSGNTLISATLNADCLSNGETLINTSSILSGLYICQIFENDLLISSDLITK